jgi:REP element-mobilizing transposase RayT
VGLFKGISGSMLFREFPELKSRVWGREVWENGYFVRTVGDEVTAEVIRK